MAASTTELIMRFTGDPRQLRETIAAVRKDLSGLSTAQVAAVRDVSRQTVIETSRAEQKRIADTIKAANQRLKEEQRAAKEVARIVAETARQAEQQEKIRERAAKQLADVRIREGKRAAKELEKSLGSNQAQGIDLTAISGVAGKIPGLSGIASDLTSISNASAATGTASVALAGSIGIVVAAFIAEGAAIVTVVEKLVDITKRTAEFEGNLFDVSQQLGISVELLSSLQILATTTGGSLETISASLGIFQRNLEQSRDPTSKEAKLLEDLGVTVRDTEGALRQTIAGLFAMGEGAKQTDAVLQLFGRSGRFVNAILKESHGNLDEAIRRFRELGIEVSTGDAKAADEFNDSLAELNFQIRAAVAIIAHDLLPSFIEILTSVRELVTAVRPLLSLLGTGLGVTARAASFSLKGLGLVVGALTGDYRQLAEAIKEAREQAEIKPLTLPDLVTPLPSAVSPRQAATDAINQAEAVVAAVKRSVATQNQALDSLFQQGRKNREQQADETINENSRILKAEQDRIDAQLALKEQEIKALDAEQARRGEIVKRDSDQYRAITAEIVKLQQDRLNKENEFEVTSAAIRAKAAKERADSTRNQIANETDLLVNEFDRQISAAEAQIKRGAIAEADGLTVIEQIEQAKIEARRESLEKQKAVGFLTVQNQVDLNNQLQKINQEADRLEDEQRARRLQRDFEAAQHSKSLKLAEIDTTLELQRIAGERTIATIQQLADLRKKTEEQAAREILRIKLDLIDQEIEATQTKLKATASIVDVKERTQAQADLNNQIKILNEQRKTIDAEGQRGIEAGRQKDLTNELRYVEELKRIKERVLDVERGAARAAISLMYLHSVSRQKIIKARLQLDIEDENSRHQQALETIRELERENRESIKTAQEKLEAEREINLLREAEERRHQLELEAIKDEAKKKEVLAGPFGGFVSGLEAGQLKELENGVTSLADVATAAFGVIGAAVNGLAQGVSSLIQNWVLMGTTGPAAFKKLVASVLASVAAQAAVLAIMELAYGIAALTPWGAAVYGPALAHFKAAALFGSIALGAGLIGRAVAGNSFQQNSGNAFQQTPPGVGRSAATGTTTPAPVNLDRATQNQQAITLNVNVKRDAGSIVEVTLDDHRNNGPIRQMILSELK